ncbi:MAG: c-type cytochrome [Pseudolabrys sp.]
MLGRILLGLAVVAAVVFGAFFAWQWRGELPPASTSAHAFDPGIVAKGAQLAAIGECGVCHTRAGGRAYAGGFPVQTPFGVVYGTNIAPDRDTGIGAWSEEAFRRAIREGVARDGTHLYPAFPYDHFTRLTDGDISALYAFLMTREPVAQPNRPSELDFPLNFRIFAAGWQLLFLTKGPYQSDPSHNAAWNRGAYLTESVGHCGGCHTPRNSLGVERKNEPFGGGASEGWSAPALNAASPAPVPWTADQLYAYLRTGFADQHGFAAGPMQSVTANLAKVPDADVRAIATYVASFIGPRDKADRQRQTDAARSFAQQRAFTVNDLARTTTGVASADDRSAGGLLFAGACASCHRSGGGLPASRPVALALSTPVNASDPTNLLRIVAGGIHPPAGKSGPIMPGFSGALTDPQIVALVDYVRAHYSRGQAWPNIAATLADIRRNPTPAMEAP